MMRPGENAPLNRAATPRESDLSLASSNDVDLTDDETMTSYSYNNPHTHDGNIVSYPSTFSASGGVQKRNASVGGQNLDNSNHNYPPQQQPYQPPGYGGYPPPPQQYQYQSNPYTNAAPPNGSLNLGTVMIILTSLAVVTVVQISRGGLLAYTPPTTSSTNPSFAQNANMSPVQTQPIMAGRPIVTQPALRNGYYPYQQQQQPNMNMNMGSYQNQNGGMMMNMQNGGGVGVPQAMNNNMNSGSFGSLSQEQMNLVDGVEATQSITSSSSTTMEAEPAQNTDTTGTAFNGLSESQYNVIDANVAEPPAADSFVPAVPAVSTIPAVSSVPDPYATTETASIMETVPAVGTVPTMDTVPTMETVPAMETVPTMETAPAIDTATLTTMETVPTTEVAATTEAVPAVTAGTTEEKIGPDESLPLTELSMFKDNWEEWEPSDTPIFFHIPKAGGSTVKDIIGTCHRFVMATETGVTDGHADDTEIAVVYPGGGPKGSDRSPFVNVDTTTVEGIMRAKEMGFADSGLADAVATPFIYEANDLFTETAKGRLFTVFRHPIDRAISMFYYLQVADWEPTYDPELKNWSIEQYATSPRIENNWLTRQLSNQLGGELQDEHLQIAMEVIRRKFMVGLMTEIERTMTRLEQMFRWTYHVNPPNQEACREKLLSGGSNSNSKNKKAKPEPGSKEWELLEWQNLYDMQLYNYIEELFEQQEEYVSTIPQDIRNIDATCCKCDPPTFPPEGFECPLAILF